MLAKSKTYGTTSASLFLLAGEKDKVTNVFLLSKPTTTEHIIGKVLYFALGFIYTKRSKVKDTVPKSVSEPGYKKKVGHC